jgi:hypothetical protein
MLTIPDKLLAEHGLKVFVGKGQYSSYITLNSFGIAAISKGYIPKAESGLGSRGQPQMMTPLCKPGWQSMRTKLVAKLKEVASGSPYVVRD